MTVTKDSLNKANTTRALNQQKRKQAKLASVTHLEGGAVTYMDSPPGVGFVLEFRSRKCYFATKDLAIEMWTKKYSKDFGKRGEDGELTKVPQELVAA
jgi:hypothetical protein